MYNQILTHSHKHTCSRTHHFEMDKVKWQYSIKIQFGSKSYAHSQYRCHVYEFAYIRRQYWHCEPYSLSFCPLKHFLNYLTFFFLRRAATHSALRLTLANKIQNNKIKLNFLNNRSSLKNGKRSLKPNLFRISTHEIRIDLLARICEIDRRGNYETMTHMKEFAKAPDTCRFGASYSVHRASGAAVCLLT